MNEYRINLSNGMCYETNGFDGVADVLRAIKGTFSGDEAWGDGMSVMNRPDNLLVQTYSVEQDVIINPMHVMSIEQNPRS